METYNVLTGGKNILLGTEAIEYAEKHGVTVNKLPDAIVGACWDLSTEDARDALEVTPALAPLFWVEVK